MQPSNISQFKIISGNLLVNKNGNEIAIDITNDIIEFEVFEHIDKSYLTARFVIVNRQSKFESINFQGTEKVSIEFETFLNQENDAVQISKTFVAYKIAKSVMPTERQEVFYMNAYEDIAFQSSLININKCYSGNLTNIIGRIFSEYLSKSVISSDIAHQKETKVIVPNLSPIRAAHWIKNSMTTSDGLPFFLFSTLAKDEIFLYDLGKLLRSTPVNQNYPFLYWQSSSNVLNAKFSPILKFKYENIENMFTLINNGAVSGQYNFIDTLKNKVDTVKFNSFDDAFSLLSENDYIKTGHKTISDNSYFNSKPISSSQHKNISIVSSSAAFTSENYSISSLNERSEKTEYSKNVISNSLKNFLSKAPISIIVDGAPFVTGTGHYTIGNTVRILFLDNDVNNNQESLIDTKKSGDYIMCAAKHHFTTINTGTIRTHLLCGKLSSFPTSASIQDFIS